VSPGIRQPYGIAGSRARTLLHLSLTCGSRPRRWRMRKSGPYLRYAGPSGVWGAIAECVPCTYFISSVRFWNPGTHGRRVPPSGNSARELEVRSVGGSVAIRSAQCDPHQGQRCPTVFLQSNQLRPPSHGLMSYIDSCQRRLNVQRPLCEQTVSEDAAM
jgi:hypothetical protein